MQNIFKEGRRNFTVLTIIKQYGGKNMQVSELNEKLKSLEHRINKLKDRIRLQKVGPEVDTAKKILYRVEEKYNELKKNNGIFIAEATSVKKNNKFSEEELIERLGAIYWIFGPSYEETVSYKRYRIEFLQILPNDNSSCLMRVQVHIYENDKPLMMNNVVIEFWKGWNDSTEVDDMGISSDDPTIKYDNFHWFQKIEYTLAKTWNKYFQNVPLIEAKKSGLLEANTTRYLEKNRR